MAFLRQFSIAMGLFLFVSGCARTNSPSRCSPARETKRFGESPSYLVEEDHLDTPPLPITASTPLPSPARPPDDPGSLERNSETKRCPPLSSPSGAILFRENPVGVGAYASYTVYDPQDDDYDLRLEYSLPSLPFSAEGQRPSYYVVVTDQMVYTALQSYGPRIGYGWVEGDLYRIRITVGSRLIIPWSEAYLRNVIRVWMVMP